MAKLRVVVLMGGKTPEHDVSLVTGREVVRHLDKKKYWAFPVVVSRNGAKWQPKSVEEILSSPEISIKQADRKKRPKEGKIALSKAGRLPFRLVQKPDVVFIAMHGPFGEDGTVQGMLDLAGIPYTGAGVLASVLGMNKILFKKIIQQEGINVPKFLVFEKGDSKRKILQKFKFPLVVKPSDQGSSVGVSIVHSQKKLSVALNSAFSYSKKLLVEEYLLGIEVSCGVLGNEDPVALPVIEIVSKREFFDYEAKYDAKMCEEIVPARIPKRLTKKVQQVAVKVFKAIYCRGFGRVDMIISQGKPHVLEINTIPGLTPSSLFPQEAVAAGISYPQMLNRIIELALEK